MRGATKRWYNRINATATSAGTNTITLAYGVAPAAYVTGDRYCFKAGGTNTAAATLNINALGAKTIQRAGAALNANDIQSGFFYEVAYDGTNFQIVLSSANIPANYITTGTMSSARVAGTTTNDSAAAGSIGEYVTNNNIAAPVSLSSNTPANLTSISLTAGDWDVSGTVLLSASGGMTTIEGDVNSTSASFSGFATQMINGAGLCSLANLQTAVVRFSLSVTTTVYLVGMAAFGGGVSVNASGTIRARRVR
jgi:hypothetical protein